MKKIFLIIILILLVANISAIRINEVESNPAGADSGNEWIEFYNSGNVNLAGYKLVNNDGDEIQMSGSFSGYYVYIFSKQWLDNTDEKVFLYEGDKLEDETDLFDDGENDGKTWQFCGGDWKFLEDTEEDKNDCSVDSAKEEDKSENSNDGTLILNSVENNPGKDSLEIKTPEVIVLNSQDSKDIKSNDNKKSLSKNDYALYGFVGFCVLLVFLFVIRKKVQNKNEFE